MISRENLEKQAVSASVKSDASVQTDSSVRRRLPIHSAYLFLAFPLNALFIFLKIPSVAATQSMPIENSARFLIVALITCAITLFLLVFAHIKKARFAEEPVLLPCILLMITGELLYLSQIFGYFDSSYFPIFAASLLGVGGALLMLSWAKAYSFLSKNDALLHTALSFCAAPIINLCIEYLPFQIEKTLIAVVLLIFSAIALEIIFLTHKQTKIEDSIPQKAPWEDFSSLWKIICGALLCLMISGCSWGTALGNAQFAGTSESLICKNIGYFLAGLVVFGVLLFSSAKRRGISERFFNFIPVVGAALLLISWFLALIDQTTTHYMANFLVTFSMGLFYMFVWSSLAQLAGTKGRNAISLFGFYLGIMLVVVLLCIALAFLLVDAAEYLTPVAAVIYLVIFNFDFTKAPGAKGVVKTPDENSFSLRLTTIGPRYHLSPREQEILPYLARGLSATYIADELCVSINTVKTHTRRIYEKLGIHSKDNLIALIGSTDADEMFFEGHSK